MRFLTFIALFASTAAMACPNLAGNYKTCRSSTGQRGNSHNVTLSQSVAGGVTTFVLNYTDEDGSRVIEKFVADGRPVVEEMAENGMRIRSTTVSSCGGTTANVGITLQNLPTLAVLAKINVVITKNGKKMIQQYSGQAMGQPVSDVVTCE